jgi:hypothetical protein
MPAMRRRYGAAAVSALAWVALILQGWLLLRTTLAAGGSVGGALVVLFGYFTILSNLFVALTTGAVAFRPGSWLASPSLRGCATTSIVLVGLGYHLLLREVWDPQGWQRLADTLLHYAVPVATLAYWLSFPPSRAALPARAPLLWAAYPVAYLAYALIRGELLGSYPYPFVDVSELGYARVLGNAAGLLLGFVAMGALLRLRTR